MPTIHEALVDYLKTYPGVQALVGTRIFPSIVPANTTYPALTYHLLPSRHTHVANYVEAQFSLTAWSKSVATSWAVAKQLRLALDGFHGDMATVHCFSLVHQWFDGDYEDDTQLYPVRVYARIWYKEAAA